MAPHTLPRSGMSEAVAEAVTRILEITRKSGGRIPEVVSDLESLRVDARSLAVATGSREETVAPSADPA